MNAFHVVPAFQRNALQHVQRFDDGDTAGARRRRSQNFPRMTTVFVLRAQDLADLRLVLGEVVECDQPSELRHVIHDDVSGLAAIELGGTIAGDALERGGELRLTKRIPRLKHLAVVQKDPAAESEALESRALRFKLVRKPFTHWKAVLGKANRRSHNVGELHGAIGFQR